MPKKIVVFSDMETWETVGDASIWEITDDAFDALCEGERPKDLADEDVIRTLIAVMPVEEA